MLTLLKGGKMQKNFNTELKIITMVVPEKKAYPMLEHLHENGFTMANVHNARGSFIGGAVNKHGEALQDQQQVLTCVLPKDQADEVFVKLHEMAEFSSPDSGFMYMENLHFGSTYVLPEVGS